MKSYLKSGGIILLIYGLASCKVSKDVMAPDMGLPASYYGASAADTGSVGKLSWQSFFGDTELKALIADALSHNNDFRLALKNIEAASLTLSQAKLGNIPSVGLQVSANSSRPSNNSFNGLTLSQFLGTNHIEDYSIAANLSWEADIWGKIRSQEASALAGYLGTLEAGKLVQTQLISDVSKGYYNLLMLDAQLAIARQNVQLNDSTLSIIRLQYDAGQASSLAVQQAEAQKLTAAGLIPQFEQQITVQENAMSILSGRLPSAIKRSIKLDSARVPEQAGTGVPAELLARRPDIRQAELALSRANANVGYAKANMYPSLSITAQGGIDAFKASNWFNIPASLFGAVAGSLAQPLFEQKKLGTLYKVAKVNREQAVLQFRQSVLIAAGEVSDALVTINKLKQRQVMEAQRSGILLEATMNSQLLFRNGLANYLEVITAQGNVLQSQLELATIRKARLDANVDLYRALGGGWN